MSTVLYRVNTHGCLDLEFAVQKLRVSAYMEKPSIHTWGSNQAVSKRQGGHFHGDGCLLGTIQ